MTTGHKLAVFLVVVLLVLCGLGARLWQIDREARIKAEATAAAQEQIVAAKNQDIAHNDAQAAQYAAALATKAAGIQTPAQAVQVIEHYMPAATAQPIATVAKADLPASVQKNLPDSASFALLSQDQVKQVAKDELACDATTNTLKACTADVADLHAVVTAKTTEAATWEAAAKGGTKWQRLVHVLKLTGCAAGGAGVGAIATKHSPVGPAIGSAAGVTACSLF